VGWDVSLDFPPYNDGLVLHYSGGTWTIIEVLVGWVLNAVHFTSPDEGWAVGEDRFGGGVLFHYSGGTWTSVSPPVLNSATWGLKGVHLTSPDEGWAVGTDQYNGTGVLLHYSGGIWTSIPSPSVNSPGWGLNGVHFTSPDEGWAVGQEVNGNGVLLHYSSGTWTSVPPPPVSIEWGLYGVHFTSPGEGWAVGNDFENQNGVLLHYSGGTWTSVSPPAVGTDLVLNGVHFTSEGEGWAVGGATGTGALLWYQSPIYPKQGTLGTVITLRSSNYGSAKKKVLLGGTSLKVLEWTDEMIRCTISKPLQPGSYDLNIQDLSIVMEDAITIAAPQINAVNPPSGSANDEITINGSLFGTKKGKVTLGGKNCKVTSWTMEPTTGESAIKTVVPKGLSPGTYELRVTNGVGSDSVDFTID
jgi:hypothetical protein